MKAEAGMLGSLLEREIWTGVSCCEALVVNGHGFGPLLIEPGVSVAGRIVVA
jgi:hypothetical protein